MLLQNKQGRQVVGQGGGKGYFVGSNAVLLYSLNICLIQNTGLCFFTSVLFLGSTEVS